MKASALASTLAAGNDAHRRSLIAPRGGQTVMTAGVAGLPAAQLAAVFRAVARFDTFTPDNDPYGEHDFGRFVLDGEAFNWKIDYYADASMEFGAEAPAVSCYRVLTIMFAREY